MINIKTVKRSPIIQALFIALFVFITSACGKKGFCFSQDLGVCYNPLGLLLETKLFYRIPLSSRKGVLWENTKLDIGFANEWTPADNFLGARITIEPIAIFNLTLKTGFYGMYNLFGYGLFRFDSSCAEYDSKSLDDLNPETVPGYWVYIIPMLKFKFKSIILVNSFKINLFFMQGDGYFLELRSYSIHKTKDTDFQNKTYLMYEFSDKIIAGFEFHVLRTVKTSVKNERVSVMGIVKPRVKDKREAYILAVLGMYLRDPLLKNKLYFALKGGFSIKGIGNKE